MTDDDLINLTKGPTDAATEARISRVIWKRAAAIRATWSEPERRTRAGLSRLPAHVEIKEIGVIHELLERGHRAIPFFNDEMKDLR